jgi:quercetin dioxygenase-like cupin family protein
MADQLRPPLLPGPIRSAQVVLPGGANLAATIDFFIDLGFRVDSIHPADAPTVAVLSGHGLRLRFEAGAQVAPGALRFALGGVGSPSAPPLAPTSLVAPNGTTIDLVDAAPSIPLPPLRPALSYIRASESGWVTGRAGMGYRDLLPDRQGGRFVASHIRIAAAGPVPDYVHYHHVRFQLIFCWKGWVRLVYEDQGAPFVLAAGDAVLQPPGIRHRVLESSAGLEVIEVGAPAVHETHADHELSLPTPKVDPERKFAGQRFVLHRVAQALWAPAQAPGFEARDLGIGEGTSGIARAAVLRAAKPSPAQRELRHHGELCLLVALGPGATATVAGLGPVALAEGDALAVPAGVDYGLGAERAGVEIFAVTVPA